jgi:hypothetical protein
VTKFSAAATKRRRNELGDIDGMIRRDPASLRPQPRRDGHDFWPTPPCLTRALTHNVLPCLQPTLVWECAAGDGRLAQAMRAAGYTVIASDIAPRGEGIEGRDFLRDQPPQAAPVAVTNPPFNRLNQFITRGLQLLDHGQITGLVLLVRWDALTAGGRADALNRAAGVLTCCWRPVWVVPSSGGGRWSNAWVWWLQGHTGPPVSRWLRPERKRCGLVEAVP